MLEMWRDGADFWPQWWWEQGKACIHYVTKQQHNNRFIGWWINKTRLTEKWGYGLKWNALRFSPLCLPLHLFLATQPEHRPRPLHLTPGHQLGSVSCLRGCLGYVKDGGHQQDLAAATFHAIGVDIQGWCKNRGWQKWAGVGQREATCPLPGNKGRRGRGGGRGEKKWAEEEGKKGGGRGGWGEEERPGWGRVRERWRNINSYS